MMIRTALILAAALFTFPAQAADKPETPVTLERLLHGRWEGGPCVGDFQLAADGTFQRQHYTPGNNALSGTWQMRWDALPPTLVLTCKASDDADSLPPGRIWKLKLLELDDESLAYQHADYPKAQPVRYTRVEE